MMRREQGAHKGGIGRRVLVAMMLVMLAGGGMVWGQTGSREVRLMDMGWRFGRGDMAGAEAVDFDDAGWERVDLPHDFLIGQPWVAPDAGEQADNSDQGNNVKSRLSPRGFKAMGVGWYRKEFTPDEAWRGRRVLLDFEGMMLVGDAWLNGQRIGGTDYGYLGFEADVTNLLRWGERNVIAVRTDTREPENSRWYTGGGLYRDVRMVVTDPEMYFTRHSLKIVTEHGENGEATVRVQSEMHCQRDSRTRELHVEMEVADADGRVVAKQEVRPAFRAGQKTREYDLGELRLTDAHLWSCETPYLYKLRVRLHRTDGSVADEIEEPFGVRTLEFSPEFGMKLNGKKVLLKGIANHHTLGALGAAAYPRALEKRIQLLKAFGFNHIRTSHNPYSESLLRLCDQYGILVVDELYDKWLDRYAGGRRPWTELWQHDIPEFIKRDRNHPSVVVWSLGNELQTYWDLPFADWGVTAYKMQRELLHRYDATRPVTVAMHPRGRDPENDSLPAPLARITDIAAYNYRYMYFPGDGRRYPYMIFYQSEANTAMLGPNWFEMDLDRVLGAAYWGMIDYLGESQGWPAKGWAQGVFDISLEPKPAAWLVKSMFSDEPTVHIGVFESGEQMDWNGIKTGMNRTTENWTDRQEGELLTLYTYTNADEVELFVNGKSQGTKRNNRTRAKERNQIRWEGIVWSPGRVTAVARNDGREVARHMLETTGKAVALKLEPDLTHWKADGMDLQHVRITAVDSKGRRVRGCRQLVGLDVSGGARLVAVGNGDMESNDLNVGTQIHLADGAALAILRSGTEKGEVRMAATADGLKAAKMKFSLE